MQCNVMYCTVLYCGCVCWIDPLLKNTDFGPNHHFLCEIISEQRKETTNGWFGPKPNLWGGGSIQHTSAVLYCHIMS